MDEDTRDGERSLKFKIKNLKIPTLAYLLENFRIKIFIFFLFFFIFFSGDGSGEIQTDLGK